MNGEEVKVSYNPFEMWSSYVGALIGAISVPIFTWLIGMGVLSILGLCKGEFCTDGGSDVFRVIIMYIPSIVLGFLIGWGIHSFIRRLRNK